MKFKSFAEVKRALVVGSFWKAYHHGLGAMMPRMLGRRVVSRVQTNGVWFRDGELESWLDFPKASDVELIEDGFIVLENGKPLLTYRKVD